ncbi:MAG: GtrA family protein [Rhodanobacter sp.]
MAPLNYLQALVVRSRFFRFLISGGINTVATYAIYLVLLRVVEYRVAYTIAYVIGIFLAYAINRMFVFRTHRGWSSALLFPLVYLVQYLVSIASVWIWVDKLDLPKVLAPSIAILVTVPMTYLLSRFVFMKRKLPAD